jgi:hypothetical protein
VRNPDNDSFQLQYGHDYKATFVSGQWQIDATQEEFDKNHRPRVYVFLDHGRTTQERFDDLADLVGIMAVAAGTPTPQE